MIKYLIFFLTFLIMLSCSSGIQILKLDEKFITSEIDNKTFIVVPKTGYWIGSKAERQYFRFPETEQFLNTFCQEFSESHPCVQIIIPIDANKYYPEIEFEMYEHEYCFNKITREDSIFFQTTRIRSKADYLIHFEEMGFGAMESGLFSPTLTTDKKSEVIVQVWDLEKIELVARLISEGYSMDVAGFFREGSSRGAVRDCMKKIIKQFPKCTMDK